MKKNKLMRLASVLLVLTLLTTCVIGGTYAKYITSDSAHDVARVAKFGVVASVSGDLFGPSYSGQTSGNKVQVWSEHAATVSASSNSGSPSASVVAPGTQGDKDMVFSVKGTPEVSTAVTFTSSRDANGADAKQYASTVELVAGTYGVMVPYTGDYTEDTIADYYVPSMSIGFAHVDTTDPDYDPTATIYELRDIATVAATASGVTGHDYLPIVWKYSTTNNSGTQTPSSGYTESYDLKDVFNAIKSNFNGQSFTPNSSNELSAKLNWCWNFENDTLTSTTAVAKTTGEIYSNADPADTILGDMIALDSNNKLNGDSYVVKLADGTIAGKNDTWNKIELVEVKAVGSDSNTNTVFVACEYPNYSGAAYTGDILDNGAVNTSGGVCAILTVTFDAAITVAQVD